MKSLAAAGFVILSLTAVFFYIIPLSKENWTTNKSEGLPDLQRYLVKKTWKNSKRLQYDKQNYYICPDFVGGMGNQMFQFASSYGISRQKNMQVLIHENCKLMSVFALNVVLLKNLSICQSFRTIREDQNAIFDRKLLSFDPFLNVRLTVFLQSHRYFDQFKSDLRRQFTFRSDIQSQANLIMENNLQLLKIICETKYAHSMYTVLKHGNCVYAESGKKVVLVGMHVRRGNWLKDPHPRLGFQTASKEYLKKAVDWYESRYINSVFIIASNDMEWTKKNIPKNVTVIYLENFFPSVDMAVLALCDHFISTVGTFSWWAGWLTGGNVTYYKWPARENTEFRRSFNKDFSDHFYMSWIGL